MQEMPFDVAEPQNQEDVVVEESPRYSIVIKNDSKSDFGHVILLLTEVFSFSELEAIEITKKIHAEGNAIVWTGCKEVGELRYNQCDKFKKDNAAFVGDLEITLEQQ